MDFIYKGRRIQKSTKLRNINDARDAESAERTRLAKGDWGIEEKKSVPCPTLDGFKASFMAWVRSKTDHARTWEFYETCYDRLSDAMGRVPLDQIDEPLI